MTEAVAAADDAVAVVRNRDRWLLRVASGFMVLVLVAEPLLVVAVYELVGQVSHLQSVVDANDEDSRSRALTAQRERQAIADELASANSKADQLATDNDALRSQLEHLGVKPAVPRRSFTTTTRPAGRAPNPPPGSGARPTTPTTTPCEVCVVATCVTTPKPVCP